jgi:hypothetical protein
LLPTGNGGSKLSFSVTHNQVTRYTGSFFGSGGSGSTSDVIFCLTAAPDWDSLNSYTF